MPDCSRELGALKDWSCTDRNGLSNTEARAAAARAGEDALAALQKGQSLLQAIVAGDLSTLSNGSLGGQKQLAMMVTVLAAISCCAVCVTARLGRAACITACRRAAGLRRVPVQVVAIRPRAATRKGSTPLRTTEDDDEILGDDGYGK